MREAKLHLLKEKVIVGIWNETILVGDIQQLRGPNFDNLSPLSGNST